MLFASDHLSQDLTGRSIRGGMTTIGSQGGKFVLTMAGTVILARLLTPTDFGLFGMVTVVTGFAEMFKDAGLSMATVQQEKITHEQISTLFWVNVLISAALGLCVLAGSPLVAWFYGRPELTAVTAALSVSFLIGGLAIQHQALLRRHMRFGALAAIQIGSQAVSLLTAIGLARLGYRHWALVAGVLSSALAGTLLTFLSCPWIPCRMRRGTGVRDMLRFGGHLTAFNCVNYFSRNADNILIGKYIGADALGLYARAYSLFMLPIGQIRTPLEQVALPGLSSLRNEPERYLRYYRRFLDIVASLTLPVTMYCAVEAHFLVPLLLGPQWLGAVPVFRILAIAGFIQPVLSTAGPVMISHGYSKRYLLLGSVVAFVYVLSFVGGLSYGIRGVAAFYAAANYVVFLPTLWCSFRGTPVTLSLFLATLLPPFLLSVLAAAGIVLARAAGLGNTVGGSLLLAGVFAAIYGGGACCRETNRDTIRRLLLAYAERHAGGRPH
jgi:PST family polysaccharide transporter